MISYHKGIIEYNVKPILNVYAVPLRGCVMIYHTNKSEKANLGGGLISKSPLIPQQQA
jgi:hypothetical protein